jgi:myo-inositol-1(or 4)-monophosphatase
MVVIFPGDAMKLELDTILEKLTSIVTLAAREELLPGFGVCEFDYKEDNSIVTAADLAMQNRLQKEMTVCWPEIPVLGEEMTVAQQQKLVTESKEYWCIDPLDGTNNYATGMPCFAVSVALVRNGEVVLGLIHDPVREESFTAIKGQGAYLNGRQLVKKPVLKEYGSVIAEIDMKRLPSELAVRLVTDAPYSSQRNIGSSALDWCWLAAGRYNVYLHGGQKLWDYAAGQLILEESGGCSVSLDNFPVFRNRLETRSVLASMDPGIFEHWKKWIGIH